MYGGIGLIDIIGGAMSNLIAGTLAWYIAQKNGILLRLLGTFVKTIHKSIAMPKEVYLAFVVLD